jgi:hypothetical protein
VVEYWTDELKPILHYSYTRTAHSQSYSSGAAAEQASVRPTLLTRSVVSIHNDFDEILSAMLG